MTDGNEGGGIAAPSTANRRNYASPQSRRDFRTVAMVVPLWNARAAFLRKAARDNLLGRRVLPFYNLYEVEEEEVVS